MTSLRDLYNANNPPFHDAALDLHIHAHMAHAGIAHAIDDDTLHNIAVAGALINAKGEIYGDDLLTLTAVAQQLAHAGTPIHLTASFRFYNLLPPVSSDFLRCTHPVLQRGKKPQKHDLLVVCGIPGWTSRHSRSTLDTFDAGTAFASG